MPQCLTEDDAPYLKVLLYTEKYSKLRCKENRKENEMWTFLHAETHRPLPLSLSLHAFPYWHKHTALIL